MQYILPMARNLRTGETVKTQDLAGRRYRQDQRRECQMMADRLAQQMSDRSSDRWEPIVREYSAD